MSSPREEGRRLAELAVERARALSPAEREARERVRARQAALRASGGARSAGVTKREKKKKGGGA